MLRGKKIALGWIVFTTLIGLWVFLTIQVGNAANIPFTSTTISSSSSPVTDPWEKAIADVTGDGQPDLIVGGPTGPVVFYKYPDWARTTVAGTGSYDSGCGIAIDAFTLVSYKGVNTSAPIRDSDSNASGTNISGLTTSTGDMTVGIAAGDATVNIDVNSQSNINERTYNGPYIGVADKANSSDWQFSTTAGSSCAAAVIAHQ